jgi:autotransporter-associated beta strand protein
MKTYKLMGLVALAAITAAAGGALLATVIAAQTTQTLPAFPGAGGFGAFATGGRGGSIYIVTNLNDSGPGSFRDAVSQPNRYVVFAVGGIIRINSPIRISANLTIAGQTAPGGGVTIYGNGLSLSNANHTIMRYLRVRMGVVGDSGTDAISIAQGDKMIFDHVSVSWGRDETFSVSGTPSNITIQDSIIAQGLQSHSAGGLIQTDGGVSIIRSLYLDNQTRNPKVKGVNEYVNNVVYNWGTGGCYILGDSAGQSYANVIENYFIAGPNTGIQPFTRGNLNFHIYARNNYYDGNVNGTLDGAIVPQADYTTVDWQTSPFQYPERQAMSATAAYGYVVANAGASRIRDRIDMRLIEEVTSLGSVGEIISDESAPPINGPGPVAGGRAPVDTDRDGMPDAWEIAVGLDPNTPDHNGDADGNGYTNIEDYINGLAPGGVQDAAITGVTDDTGLSGSDAITSDDRLMLSGTARAGKIVTVTRIGAGQVGTATSDAAGRWSLDLSSTPLPQGLHVFTARTVDASGRAGVPTPAFLVTVDRTAPALPVITSVTLDSNLTINGNSEPGSQVEAKFAGGASIGRGIADDNGLWSVSFAGPPLEPGVHSFTAVATDKAGNVGVEAVPYTVDTSIQAPVIISISEDSGVSATDRLTNDSTLSLNGTAFPGMAVTVSLAGVGAAGTIQPAADGRWTFDYSTNSLSSGVYSFMATATDAAGHSSPATPPFVVTVDTNAPLIDSILRQNPLVAATTATEVTFRVNFNEPVIGVDLGDFTLTTTGTATGMLSVLTPRSDRSFDLVLNGVAGEGTVRAELKAAGTGILDLAGNAVSTGFAAGQTFTIRAIGSSVWVNPETGGTWSDSLNWEQQAVASGISSTADFAALDITEDVAVTLDAPRTLGYLVFGDLDPSTVANWRIDDGGTAGNTTNNALIMATNAGSPAITVNALGAPATATINAVIESAGGLTKSGAGTLVLTRPNRIEGPLTVGLGSLRIGDGGSLDVTSLTVAGNISELNLAGGMLKASGLTTLTPRNSAITIDSGTAQFDGGVTCTNTRDAIFRVRGGSVSISDLNFPRTSDATINFGSGLLIQGGTTTIGSVSLGTANSWGVMSVEDGSLTVAGPLTVGYQVTSGRGGAFRVTGGSLKVADTALGIVMARNPGTNPNNVANGSFSGGVSTVGRLTLGYDATVTAGSANVTLNGGALYLGAGGIVKNGIGNFAANVNLASGLLGAADNWSSDLNFMLPEANALTIKAADASDLSRDIILSGSLSGAGGLTKTGAGTLLLRGANTFTGQVRVTSGALRVDGSLASGEALTINGTGFLTGSGSIAREIALDAGGTIVPGGPAPLATLSAKSLTWNGGGQLAFDLAAGNRLALMEGLTRGSGSRFNVVLSASGPLSVGTVYTLATYSSTNLTSAELTYTGLNGYRGVLLVGPSALQFLITGAGATAEYSHWAYLNLPEGRRGLSDDPDGDGLANLLEFSLGADQRQAGGDGMRVIEIEENGKSYPAIVYTRRQNRGGIGVEVKVSPSLDFAALLGSVEISAEPRGDGIEEVVARSIVPLAEQSRQFFRLGATLDTTPETTQTTMLTAPVGAVREILSRGRSGLSLPLIAEDLFTGVVQWNAGNVLTFTGDAIKLGALLSNDARYYVEVVTGPLEGERLDVDLQTTIARNDSTLVLTLNEDSFSTIHVLANNALAGARCVIRPYITLSGLQALFKPGLAGLDNPLFADGVWLMEGGELEFFYLRSDGATWNRLGSHVDYRHKIIPPDVGLVVKSAGQSWMQGGRVRTNDFRKNLTAGLQSLATGYPVDLSPVQIGAYFDQSSPFETSWTGNHLLLHADQIYLPFQPTLLDLYFLAGDGSSWRRLTDSTDVSNRPIIDATGMVILRRIKPNPNYKIKRPFEP